MAKATLNDIEFQASDLQSEEGLAKLKSVYEEYGCLVIRSLTNNYVEHILTDLQKTVDESYKLYPEAERTDIGLVASNGTVFMPKSGAGEQRHQIMVLAMSYRNSAALLQSALDKTTLDVAETLLGPNVELFLDGQSIYKEPNGGLEKNLHQDSAYFEHHLGGPLAFLNYLIPTTEANGALYVVPGSHKRGVLPHENTSSHLGLSDDEISFEDALLVEGEPGDAIVFHANTIHGSKQNRTDKARPNFINRYRSVDDSVKVHAITKEQRKKAESDNASDKKTTDDWGLVVRGRRITA